MFDLGKSNRPKGYRSPKGLAPHRATEGSPLGHMPAGLKITLTKDEDK
ncbi:hypothetical protein H1P_920018 [Hyella patelloides LEGE 07179]|uniref:Uncharacterized protein n=1 Tax=Hyella patelloides LEGE 07179 TaxID=945734 RepID=A0A563W546_9CYAN|nr:hypothetical protein H1P_920018 [Hyella patelloides LEGE 07179]